MTFPGAGAQIYHNEEGEVLGWDNYPGYDDEPDPNDFDEEGESDWVICNECGDEYESGDPEIEKHEAETGHKRWS